MINVKESKQDASTNSNPIYYIKELNQGTRYSFIIHKKFDFNFSEPAHKNMPYFITAVICFLLKVVDDIVKDIIVKVDDNGDVDAIKDIQPATSGTVKKLLSSITAYILLQMKRGEERDEISEEVGCPTGWSKSFDFPDTHNISMTCTSPSRTQDIALLRDICDGKRMFYSLKQQGIAALENEIEYHASSGKYSIDCLTSMHGIVGVTEENKEEL